MTEEHIKDVVKMYAALSLVDNDEITCISRPPTLEDYKIAAATLARLYRETSKENETLKKQIEKLTK